MLRDAVSSSVKKSYSTSFESEDDSLDYGRMGRYGPQLSRNGWMITPLRKSTKRPFLKRWNEATEPLTASEAADFCARYTECDVGILCRGLAAIDIDFLDPGLADAAQRIAFEVLGETAFMRIGRAPKSLLLYRTDNDIISCETGQVISGNTRSSVEILALNRNSTAKQFAAFAIHEKTGKPYDWPERSPLDCTPEQLPAVTANEIQDFVRRLNEYIEENIDVLALRGIVPATAAVGQAGAGKPGPKGLIPPADNYEDLPVKPLSYLTAALGKIRQSIFSPRGHRHEALFAAGADASEVVHSFRFRDDQGAILEALRVAGIAGNALRDAARDAINANPDDWTPERAESHLQRGWKKGQQSRRDPVEEFDAAYLNRIGAGLAAHAQSIGALSAGSAPSGAQQQQTGGTAPAWTDRHGNTHEALRPAAVAAPMRPAMPIADLQKQAVKSVTAFFRCTEAFHADKDRDVTIADQAAASHGTFLTERARFLMGEGAGSGKSTSTCDELADFYSDPDEARNVPYFVPTHVMAEQAQRDLEARGVATIRLQAPERVCSITAHKKAIEARRSQNLPVQDICRTCPARKTCPYPAQFAPAKRTVVIAQHAHLLMDHIPVIDEAGSAPLFATIIDESILGTVLQVTSLSMETLSKRIKLPPVSRKVVDDRKRKELDDDRAMRAASINECCRRLCVAVASVQWPAERDRETTRLVTKASLAWFFDRAWDGRTRAAWLQHDVSEARAALLGGTMEKARKTGTSNIRSAEAHALRVVDHIGNVLNAIIESAGNKLDVVNLHAKRVCMKNGRTYVELGAGYLHPLPKSVRKAPILFLDATGDMHVIESILREDSKAAPRMEPAPSTLIRAEDVHRPVWKETDGEADAPFLTSEKYIAAPVNARQLTAGSPEAKARRAKGSVTLNGAEYRGGQRVTKNKKRSGWLNDLRSDSSAKQVERQLRSIVREQKSGGAQHVAIFTILDFERELRLRKWVADAGVVIDHFGNLAGRNDFKDFDAIILVGQIRPPTPHLGIAGGALASAHPRAQALTVPRYHHVFLPVEIGGKPFELRAPILDDHFSEIARQQLELAQSVQAYGRLRAHLRDAGHPCKLIALDTVPGGRWGEAIVFDPPDELMLFKAIHGRLPANGKEAFQMEPELFRSAKHARELLAAALPPKLAAIKTNNQCGCSDVSPTPVAISSTPTAEPSYTISKGYRHDADEHRSVSRPEMVTSDPRSALSRVRMDDYAAAVAATGGKPAPMACWLRERTGLPITRQAIHRHRKAAAKAPSPSAGQAKGEKGSQKPQDGREAPGVPEPAHKARKAPAALLIAGTVFPEPHARLLPPSKAIGRQTLCFSVN